jgi:hypothetical protein
LSALRFLRTIYFFQACQRASTFDRIQHSAATAAATAAAATAAILLRNTLVASVYTCLLQTLPGAPLNRIQEAATPTCSLK